MIEEKLNSLHQRSVTIETRDSMYIFGRITGFTHQDVVFEENGAKEIYPVITEIELNNDPELRVRTESIKEIKVA